MFLKMPSMISRVFHLALLSAISLSSINALADCALSGAVRPRGMVGLQLVIADDPEAWTWVDELRARYVRIELRWDWLEPNEGQYDWTYIDRVVARP